MTRTLTTHTHTSPTWSSFSPRQFSACLPSASQSLTLFVPSVVHAISTRCLTLQPVAPCPSKVLSDHPHSLPRAVNWALLDSTLFSYPDSETRRLSALERWCLHRWRLPYISSRLHPPCPQAYCRTRSGDFPWYRQGGYLCAGVYLTPSLHHEQTCSSGHRTPQPHYDVLAPEEVY